MDWQLCKLGQSELGKLQNALEDMWMDGQREFPDWVVPLHDAVIDEWERREVIEAKTANVAVITQAPAIEFAATVYDYNRAGVVAFKLPELPPSSIEGITLFFTGLANARETVYVKVYAEPVESVRGR